jgi:hypothetical protein
MRPRDLPIAIVAFLGLVVVVPMVTSFVGSAGLETQDAFLAGLALPGVVLLYTASWVKPDLAGPVLGALVLASFMVMAPWLWRASGLAAGALADGSLAELAFRLALPLVILAALATAGYRRLLPR